MGTAGILPGRPAGQARSDVTYSCTSPAIPSSYVIATAILLCFCVAFSAMTRRVANNGAFYLLVARGLGKPVAGASAYIAVLAYTGLSMGLVTSFGYFFHETLADPSIGIDVPWWVFTAVGIAVVAFLGYRNVDLSAKVLGVLMAAEFAVLIVLDLIIMARKGIHAFPSAVFAPHEVFAPSVGITLMFAFASYVGFESAALYGEETRNPERSIPRAAYISVVVIAIFYFITTWVMVGAAGPHDAVAKARHDPAMFVLNIADEFGGELLKDLCAVLLLTSVLASYLALHNASARYTFAIAADGIAPKRLASFHARHRSPHYASLCISVLTVVVVGLLGLGGADPYVVISAGLVGLGTLGIILVQAISASAVLGFFARRNDRKMWSGVVAPVAATIGLVIGFVSAAIHFSTLTDSQSPAVASIPYLLPLAGVLGFIVVVRLRKRDPSAYFRFARTQLRPRTDVVLSPVDYTSTYVIVGAGPAGMVMARAMLKEGVPFDWFERHSDFGGIWDIDNTGSPMYEEAHFITSKFISGFYGAPMYMYPLPDYPSWRQIRDYIRQFGDEWGLRDAVTFNTEVISASPVDDGRWRVVLSNGETRDYAGVIAAPGVTWHGSMPDYPGMSDFIGTVSHSRDFRCGRELAGKTVLVVGAGNSGVDIACAAATHAEAAYLSVRRGYRYVPKYIAGIPTDALLAGVLVPPEIGGTMTMDPADIIDQLVGDLTRFGLPAPDHAPFETHPIMNTDVLHHLGHGDLVAKPDISHFDTSGVTFTDGTRIEVDHVIMATGYTYELPFIDRELFDWKGGRPDLYLNIFSREHEGLYVVGFIEFVDAAYKRFDEMAQMVLMDIRARETGVCRDELQWLKAHDHPDLRGGVRYVDSPRHSSYVDATAYMDYLAELRERLGWPDIDEGYYWSMRSEPIGKHAATPSAADDTVEPAVVVSEAPTMT
ncbi:amino acid permease [Gordonia jinhuaensis]|uniref:amino acid permease n=1 Tax=Gordonia jinhuaensis TaxID=1517702 RepID=UPI001666AE4F|nr:amino acid permease [Gordonia jinhuaensis]